MAARGPGPPKKPRPQTESEKADPADPAGVEPPGPAGGRVDEAHLAVARLDLYASNEAADPQHRAGRAIDTTPPDFAELDALVGSA